MKDYFGKYKQGNSVGVVFNDGKSDKNKVLKGKVFGNVAKYPAEWVQNIKNDTNIMQGAFLVCLNPETKQLGVIEINTLEKKYGWKIVNIKRVRFEERVSKTLDLALEQALAMEEMTCEQYL